MTGRIAVALLLAGQAVAGQGRPASVHVVDRETGTPVVEALVVWRAADTTEVRRGSSGRDGVIHAPPGWRDGRLVVRAIGYRATMLEWTAVVAAGHRVEMDPLSERLDPVVVTAAGRTQRRSEVAVPIQRIDGAEIASSGAASVDRLLDELPGLQALAGTPVGASVAIRGIGDGRVLVLVDGQPAGGALVENRDLGRLSLAGAERVEVVKGPLSSLYGSDALGGVINVITADPEPGFRVTTRALAGSNGRSDADVTLSGGGDVRYRVTGAWRQQDGVPGSAASGAFDRVWDARATVRAGEAGGRQLRGDLTLVRERQRWPVGGGFNGFNDNTGVTAWTEVQQPAWGGVVAARVLHQAYDHLYRSARGTAPIAGADEDRQEERLWRVASGWSRTIGLHAMDAGIELADRAITSPDKILEDRAADRQADVFAQDAWYLPRATVTGGVRVTLNDRWGHAVAPSLGATLPFRDDLRVRASAGRGFRAPSFKELAWDFANVGAGYTVQGNPGLMPERSWNLSAGMEWTPDPRTSLSVEAYTNHLRDLIEFAFTGNTPSGLLVYSPRNVQRARTSGAEASLSFRPGAWRLAAEYAWLHARNVGDDLPLDRRAPHSARLRVGTSLGGADPILVDLDGRLTSAAPLIGQDDDGLPAVSGHQERLLSLDATVQVPVTRHARLLLGADNLLDARPAGWQSVVGRALRLEVRVTAAR